MSSKVIKATAKFELDDSHFGSGISLFLFVDWLCVCCLRFDIYVFFIKFIEPPQ